MLPNTTTPRTLARIETEAAEWIARRDAGLSAAEERELQAWLRVDERNAAALERLQGAWSALDRPRRTGGAEFVLADLGRRARRRRTLRVTAAAAVVAVMATLSVVWRVERPAPAPEPVTASGAVVRVPEHRTLADGTEVELKEGARIEVGFSNEFRRVSLLSGEALFHVAKNPHRPFIVAARGVEVRAVGTAFSVGVNSRAVEVLVTEGRVAVSTPNPMETSLNAPANDASPLGAGTFVDAGNRAVVDLAVAAATPAAVQPMAPKELTERLSWRSPRLEFSGTPLSEAVALLNRYAGGAHPAHFVIEDPELAQMRVSGFFRADNSESFIHLASAFGVTADRRPNGDILLRKQQP